MRKPPCPILFLTIAVGLLSFEPAAFAKVDAGSLISVDMRGVVSHNDVVYLAPARAGWEGLPLGNGALGAQVWQPDGLMFQLNTPLSGVYGGAIARLQLGATPGMLAATRSYRQRLSLYDATLHTEITADSGKISTLCLIPADTDALVIQYSDTRPELLDGSVELEAWRPSASRTAAGDSLLVTDVLKFPNEPDYRFAVAVGVEGAAAAAEKANERTMRLRVPAKQFTVWLAFAATRDAKLDPQALAKEKLAMLRKRGFAAVQAAHAQWWANFWQKSFIKLASNDGLADYAANLWYMHLYTMAAGSRGEVPPKFNGGLWTDNYDQREWGPSYWHWNTQETYWPIFAANHLELHKPYQRMYWNMLPAVKKWTKEFWETGGAQYQETIPFNGVMGMYEKERGVHPRLPIPKQVAYTNLILSSSAEIAMQFWWAYIYTGDEAFLRARAYPLMKEVAAFYVAYLEKDEAGRYNVFPSNAHETYWKVKNPTTDLAALRYFLPVIIEASKKLNSDADLRQVWQDRFDHLAPYATDSQRGVILPYQRRPGEKVHATNGENPDLFPIGVFPLMTLGSRDYALGVRTFRARTYVNGYGWTTDSICAARLGLIETAPKNVPGNPSGLRDLLLAHAQTYQDHPSGLQDYYNRKPAIHPYLEGSGTFATAVGEMLLQSWNGLIRLAPALPPSWSGDFKLLAAGGFELSAHAEQGKVRFATLTSRRGERASVANPFDAEAVVTHGDAEIFRSAKKVLQFPTEPGETYVIARAGAPLQPLEVTAQPNDAPKRLSPSGDRWLGKPALATIAHFQAKP